VIDGERRSPDYCFFSGKCFFSQEVGNPNNNLIITSINPTQELVPHKQELEEASLTR
jgi:hypothetical protein